MNIHSPSEFLSTLSSNRPSKEICAVSPFEARLTPSRSLIVFLERTMKLRCNRLRFSCCILGRGGLKVDDWKWPGEGLEWIPIPREGDKPIIIRKCYSILNVFDRSSRSNDNDFQFSFHRFRLNLQFYNFINIIWNRVVQKLN